MKKILLYPDGGSGNHGCEAIVRASLKLLGYPCPERVYLYSMDISQDKAAGLSDICTLESYVTDVRRFSPEHIVAAIKYHIMRNKEAYDLEAFGGIFSKADVDTLALSIGGDNYCYDTPEQIYFINRHVRVKGAKTILWGCSVEPATIDGRMAEDLARYNLITARESISYKALREINENTILCTDPAFQLGVEKCDLPKGFSSGNTVGINISPMVKERECTPGILMASYRKMIRWILKETDMSVALIPHVCWPTSDDRVLLNQLYEEFKNDTRIVLINECNCMQLKYIISKCRFMIAARTHASIAAYSACVPTLVIGYSVKAKGIARDIFGKEREHIISIKDIVDDCQLLNAFRIMIEEEAILKNHLLQVMPGYCQKAFLASDELKSRGWIR